MVGVVGHDHVGSRSAVCEFRCCQGYRRRWVATWDGWWTCIEVAMIIKRRLGTGLSTVWLGGLKCERTRRIKARQPPHAVTVFWTSCVTSASLASLLTSLPHSPPFLLPRDVCRRPCRARGRVCPSLDLRLCTALCLPLSLHPCPTPLPHLNTCPRTALCASPFLHGSWDCPSSSRDDTRCCRPSRNNQPPFTCNAPHSASFPDCTSFALALSSLTCLPTEKSLSVPQKVTPNILS